MWCDYCEYNRYCAITDRWCNDFKYKKQEVKVAKLVYKVVNSCRECPYYRFDWDDGTYWCTHTGKVFPEEQDSMKIDIACTLQDY